MTLQTYNVQAEFQGGYSASRTATRFIVVHHAAALYRQATGIEDVRAVADYHVNSKGWSGIGYHIALAEEVNGGPIVRYNLSDLELQRAHILKRNHECVGVSCLTNFVGLPDPQWIDALADVLRELKQRYPQSQIVGHKEIAVKGGETACPGPRWLDWKPQLLAAVLSAPSAGLAVQSAPRITLSDFSRVLSKYGSPCASMADELYNIVTGYGLDPAVALAFFIHESSCGTAGVAKLTRNWGNVRRAVDAARVVGTHPSNFVVFRSWQDGLRDWCERLLGSIYIGAGLVTVEQIIPVYAPSSDGNVPTRYIAHVRELVATWHTLDRAMYRVIVSSGRVRSGAGTSFSVVGSVSAQSNPLSGVIVDGEAVEGDRRWLKLADRRYVHRSLVRPV